MNVSARLEKLLWASILASLIVLGFVTVVIPFSSIHLARTPYSPIPNTTVGSDGVIKLTPEKGCGPYARVEHHLGYGPLCVHDGRWAISSVGSMVAEAPPCVGPGQALLSCQHGAEWSSRR